MRHQVTDRYRGKRDIAQAAACVTTRTAGCRHLPDLDKNGPIDKSSVGIGRANRDETYAGATVAVIDV